MRPGALTSIISPRPTRSQNLCHDVPQCRHIVARCGDLGSVIRTTASAHKAHRIESRTKGFSQILFTSERLGIAAFWLGECNRPLIQLEVAGMGDVNQFEWVKKHAHRIKFPVLEIGSKNYGAVSYDYRSLFAGMGDYV